MNRVFILGLFTALACLLMALPGCAGGSRGTGEEGTPASGHATVSWDVALVRATPARDGEVRARVLSGTRVVVTGKNGDWFRIKYDAKGNQGWVYRTAIGM